jgi:hypothetical protein
LNSKQSKRPISGWVRGRNLSVLPFPVECPPGCSSLYNIIQIVVPTLLKTPIETLGQQYENFRMKRSCRQIEI